MIYEYFLSFQTKSSTMDDIVGPIKTYLAKADPSKIDNFVFKLHVRLTFALMLACMALVSRVHLKWNDCIFLSNRQQVIETHHYSIIHFWINIFHQVGAGQYFGSPISCMGDGVPGGTMDLYCWIHSTFSVSSR